MVTVDGPRRILPSTALAGCLALCTAVLACSGAPDTFIEYRLEGEAHRVEGAELLVTPLPEGLRFLRLGANEVGQEPDASVMWRVPLDDPRDLAGREWDLSWTTNRGEDVDPPLVVFDLGDDGSAVGIAGSSFRIRIAGVEDGFVEGSFAGTDLAVGALGDPTSRAGAVTGAFRARLAVEDR